MGTGEELKCVKGVERFTIPTEKSDSTTVCYAALIQTDNFIVPYKISVDSYVLAELNANTDEAGDIYYELDSEQIQLLQQEQKLPNPTPTHEIGMDTYLPAIGLIALVVAWLVWQIKAAKTAVQNSQPPSQTTTNSDDMAELERLNLETDQSLSNAQSENDNTHNDSPRCDSADSEHSSNSSSDDSCSND
ncbi:hypothetical protein RS9916_31772 [Synechococcus sp. RS9916]|nr:hypothetical protein RS9916_31772 [Synechococcus sp. RS9916]